MENKSSEKGFGERLRSHLIESTALIAETTPVFALLETQVVGMSDQNSLNARLTAAGLTYVGGLGWLYTKSREMYRKTFNVTDNAKDVNQFMHDAVHLSLLNSVVSPALYFCTGTTDLRQLGAATLTSMGIGIVNGPFMGYAVDVYRDLFDIKPCERPSYPKNIRNMSSTKKKGLAAIITAGALAATIGIYNMSNNNHVHQERTQQVAK